MFLMINCPVEDTVVRALRSCTVNDTVGWLVDEPVYLDILQTFTSTWVAVVVNCHNVGNKEDDVYWVFGLMLIISALQNAMRRTRREKMSFAMS
jgi:hypothetical protein